MTGFQGILSSVYRHCVCAGVAYVPHCKDVLQGYPQKCTPVLSAKIDLLSAAAYCLQAGWESALRCLSKAAKPPALQRRQLRGSRPETGGRLYSLGPLRGRLWRRLQRARGRLRKRRWHCGCCVCLCRI